MKFAMHISAEKTRRRLFANRTDRQEIKLKGRISMI